MQVSVCISSYWNFALSAIKDEIFLEAKKPSTKSLNLLECFSQFWTICFGTGADESLTKLYLEGVLSTNFKITDWMISQQSALNFLVFSENNTTLSKQCVPLLLCQFCLNLTNCLYPSTSLSLASYLHFERNHGILFVD